VKKYKRLTKSLNFKMTNNTTIFTCKYFLYILYCHHEYITKKVDKNFNLKKVQNSISLCKYTTRLEIVINDFLWKTTNRKKLVVLKFFYCSLNNKAFLSFLFIFNFFIFCVLMV